MSQKQNRAEVAETRRLIGWYGRIADDYFAAARESLDPAKRKEAKALGDEAAKRVLELQAQLRAAGLP